MPAYTDDDYVDHNVAHAHLTHIVREKDEEIQILKDKIKILELQIKEWKSNYAALNEQHSRIMQDDKKWKRGFIRVNDEYNAEKLKTLNQHTSPSASLRRRSLFRWPGFPYWP